MGYPSVYKKNAPAGYKEGIHYHPGDDMVNTKEDREAFTAEIADEAAAWHAISTHDKPTYPNLRPEAQAEEEPVGGSSLLAKAVAAQSHIDKDDVKIAMGGKVGLNANEQTYSRLDNIKNALKP